MSNITHVAIKVDSKIYSLPAPNRHHHIFHKYGDLENTLGLGSGIQGFLNEEGEFLNREEAKKLNPNRGSHPRELFSEDLW